MSRLLTSLLFLTSCLAALAESHHFAITPYSFVSIQTTKGKESAKLVTGSKFGEEELYQSKLKPTEKGGYEGTGGIQFKIEKLATPEIQNKGLRAEFKATHQLTIHGSGKAFDTFVSEIQPPDPTKKATPSPKSLKLFGWTEK